MLRIEGEDSPVDDVRATVADAIGSPLARYSDTTSRRISNSRADNPCLAVTPLLTVGVPLFPRQMYHECMPSSWTVVGLGRCGLQLARAMHGAGVRLVAAVGRSAANRRRARRYLPAKLVASHDSCLPASDCVLVSIPDGALESAGEWLAGHFPQGCSVVLHTSGVRSAESLADLRPHGAAVGSLHPLLPFASAGGPPVPLRGAIAAVEGDASAVAAAKTLARRLGMRPRPIAAASKERYHAAATIAASLTYALVAEAADVLRDLGWSARDTRDGLAPLIRQATGNALGAGGWRAMTGPVVRNDAATVAAHLRALSAPAAASYAEVSRLAVIRLEAARCIDESAARALLRALTDRGFSASVRPMAADGDR